MASRLHPVAGTSAARVTEPEPAPLLDAIAANPDDLGAWHVLADWLLEHAAPHAVLAAYDLKLREGTNDPELLGDYAEARRARHRLPRASGLSVDTAIWRCGYITRLRLTPRAGTTAAAARALLDAPQLSALHRLEIVWQGPQLSGGLERSLDLLLGTRDAGAAAVVRRVSLVIDEAPPTTPTSWTQISPLAHRRPPKATTLDLALKEVWPDIASALGPLLDAGWSAISFAGTALSTRDVEPLRKGLEGRVGVTLQLGATGLTAEDVRALDLPAVRWVPPHTDALLFDEATGAVYPCSESPVRVGQRLFVRELAGWSTPGGPGLRRLRDGETISDGDLTLTFHEGADLDAWYRDAIARRA